MQKGSNEIGFGEHQGVSGKAATNLVIAHKCAYTNIDE